MPCAGEENPYASQRPSSERRIASTTPASGSSSTRSSASVVGSCSVRREAPSTFACTTNDLPSTSAWTSRSHSSSSTYAQVSLARSYRAIPATSLPESVEKTNERESRAQAGAPKRASSSSGATCTVSPLDRSTRWRSLSPVRSVSRRTPRRRPSGENPVTSQ